MNMNRREFLGAGLCAAALPNVTIGADASREGVKFCVFADLHYFPAVFPHSSVEWLDRILKRAEDEKCDFIMQLGDMVHENKKAQSLVDHYNDFHIPTYHTLGNHECDQVTFEQRLESYRMNASYHFFERGGFRFICLDTNHAMINGKLEHYALSNYQKLPFKDKTLLGAEQLEWLKATIDESKLPCVLTSHGNFERTSQLASPDAPAVRKIVDDTNAKTPGKVKLVMNGHHHCDFVRLLNNVCYFDVNSANFQFMYRAHNKYPAESCVGLRRMNHVLAYNDPLCAIVTMRPDGYIHCDGMKSSFFLGITREMTGLDPLDQDRRLTTPNIQSFTVVC